MKRSELKRRSGPKRSGRTIRCQTCGKEFYVRPGQVGAKYCSRSCMAIGKRVTRKCKACGAPFDSDTRSRNAKTCSPRCENEAKRAGKLGSENPMYQNGLKSERWRTSREGRCRCCGGGGRLVLHHVVYEQHVRKAGGDVSDPDNSLTLCQVCHFEHHSASDDRIRLDQLRDENRRFAEHLLGAYAQDYLRRYYDAGETAPWL